MSLHLPPDEVLDKALGREAVAGNQGCGGACGEEKKELSW